jgi:outer membrane protein OmpA-like peptidoglycan-associated protein
MTRWCSVFLVLAACGGKPAPPTAKQPTAAVRPVPAATPAPAAPTAATPSVSVSDELVQRCKLRFANTEQAPRFGFDDAALLPEDRTILEQIAGCLVTGPLRGHRVQLIGRTDPRGTDEYNLALGSRRAETVSSYLQRLGVPASQLAATTRGETEATGVDEASWQRDRRVDVELAN